MAHEQPQALADLTPPAQLPWFRRLVARLLGRGLTRLQAQHRDSWSLGHATGYEAGRQVLVIRDSRPDTTAVPGQDDNLFDDWRLPLTAELKKRFKADVAQRLPTEAQPSAAQWKLIFSDTPSTCVVAGAGAGKSTSLVLRILLLRHYLGYELDAMTVVTFTRESRKDFIKRLLQVFAQWQINLQPVQARELVRTFHSRILPLVRSLPGFGQVRAFETLGNEMPAGREAEADSNPFDLRLNDAQRQQLNQCYSSLLGESPRFAELVGLLRSEALQLKPLDPNNPDVQKRAQVTQLAAQRDDELCDVIEDLWFAAGAWPIKGIEPCRETVDIRGSRFHVHSESNKTQINGHNGRYAAGGHTELPPNISHMEVHIGFRAVADNRYLPTGLADGAPLQHFLLPAGQNHRFADRMFEGQSGTALQCVVLEHPQGRQDRLYETVGLGPVFRFHAEAQRAEFAASTMQRHGQPIHQAGGRGFLEELVLLSRLVDGRFPENRQYALGTVTDRRVDPRVASPVVMLAPGGRVVADDEGVLVVLAVLRQQAEQDLRESKVARHLLQDGAPLQFST